MTNKPGRPTAKTDKKEIEENIKKLKTDSDGKKLARIFTERFNNEFEKLGISQANFSNDIGELDTTISKYRKGITLPRLDMLVKIAKKLNCSTDYLLGLTELKSTNEDYKIIHESTGLSDEAINYLRKMKQEQYRTIKNGDVFYKFEEIETINCILENERRYKLLKYIGDYIWVGRDLKESLKRYINNNGDISNHSFLEHWRSYKWQMSRDQAIAKVNMDKALFYIDSDIRNPKDIVGKPWISKYKEEIDKLRLFEYDDN